MHWKSIEAIVTGGRGRASTNRPAPHIDAWSPASAAMIAIHFLAMTQHRGHSVNRRCLLAINDSTGHNKLRINRIERWSKSEPHWLWSKFSRFIWKFTITAAINCRSKNWIVSNGWFRGGMVVVRKIEPSTERYRSDRMAQVTLSLGKSINSFSRQSNRAWWHVRYQRPIRWAHNLAISRSKLIDKPPRPWNHRIFGVYWLFVWRRLDQMSSSVSLAIARFNEVR